MEKKLPLYKIKVNPEDESGVYAVSLVDEPAIEYDWVKLSKQVEMNFSVDTDKKMLYGPMLVPNKMIYRRDENGYEYNIMFEKDTIELIAEKFNKNKLGDKFNFQHSDVEVEAFLKENWLTDNPDKSQKYGFDLPEGSWFGAVKIEDEDFWKNKVKEEEVKGFSVEILAGAELVELSIINNNSNKNTKEMEETKLGEVKREDGVVIYYEGDVVEVGTPLFLDPELTEAAPEGEHTLEGGVKVVIAEGKISEIIEPVEEEVEAGEEKKEEMSEEVVEEELEDVEEVVEETKEPSFEEQVLSIIQPLLDSVITQHSEILNKITEMEANIAKEREEEMSELKSQVEKLSSMAGAETITKKTDDRKIKVETELTEKINIFRKYR
jgi:hypothetical protein